MATICIDYKSGIDCTEEVTEKTGGDRDATANA